jgi:hypothetical protein
MCVLKLCKECGKEFNAQHKTNQYCSKKCGGLGRRSKGGPCTICGVKHSRKRPTGLEAWYKHPKNGKIICDSCYGKIPRKRLCVICGRTESTRWHSNEKGAICHKCAMVFYRRKVKLQVFTHYCKGKPVCCIDDCNINDMDMLSLDHVNDNGSSHRKEVGAKTGTFMYEWAIKNNYPKIFQVMCWNHNIKKQLNKVKRKF